MRHIHAWAFAALVTLATEPVTGARALRASAAAPEGATCGEFGTSLHFEKTPSEAARRALKEEKLVFVLHISGHFEDAEFT